MTSKKKQGAFDALLRSKGYRIAMKYLYAWGASVVIIGALFKILHLPGANEMLIIGLGTEAAVFFVSGLEPLPEEERHWDWAKVFPQLAAEEEEGVEADMLATANMGGPMLPGLGQASKSLQEANFTPELLEGLADAIQRLRVNVENLTTITDAAGATQEFASKVQEASAQVDRLANSYAVTADAMTKIASSFADIQSYQVQLKQLSNTVGQLNSVYESELQEVQKHIAAISRFYGGLGRMISTIEGTSQDAEQLRHEIISLNANLRGLNAIYGGMLSGITSVLQR